MLEHGGAFQISDCKTSNFSECKTLNRLVKHSLWWMDAACQRKRSSQKTKSHDLEGIDLLYLVLATVLSALHQNKAFSAAQRAGPAI